jgi:hypothetical protein
MGAISSQGSGISTSGGMYTPKDKDHRDCINKVRNDSKEDLYTVLEKIKDQEIINIR